jgi:hypothetical protein
MKLTPAMERVFDRAEQEARRKENGGQEAQPSALTLRFGWEAVQPQPLGTIVRGILHAGSLTLFYGPPKSGKSFLVTDLFLSVAAELPDWMGHKIVRPGPMLYIACEGHAGFWKRLRGAAIERGWDEANFPAGFVLATGRPVLIKLNHKSNAVAPSPDDVLAALEQCRRRGVKPNGVAVDTVFRSFGGGNVNASDHMNAYLAALATITDQGLALAAVHHETKAGGTPAGSVTLIGAADTIIATTNGPGKEHAWQVEAAKDDGETEARKFTLKVVDIGTNPEGEDVSSCVVVDSGETQPAARGRPKKQSERDLLMQFLYDALVDHGEPPNDREIPVSIHLVVHKNHVRDEYMRRTRPDDSADTKGKQFKRLLGDLQKEGRVGIIDQWMWPAERT